MAKYDSWSKQGSVLKWSFWVICFNPDHAMRDAFFRVRLYKCASLVSCTNAILTHILLAGLLRFLICLFAPADVASFPAYLCRIFIQQSVDAISRRSLMSIITAPCLLGAPCRCRFSRTRCNLWELNHSLDGDLWYKREIVAMHQARLRLFANPYAEMPQKFQS